MQNPLKTLRGLSRSERIKGSLLFGWFFVTITVLWLLKALRTGSLLANLGAAELPPVRFGAVIVVTVVVAVYSRAANRLSRLAIGAGANLLFAVVLLAFWASLRLAGEALGSARWFIWSVFILVDVFATVMVGIFWTYTNDVCSRDEADKLYAPIGLGGILGGIAGGAMADLLMASIGPVDIFLLCAGLACTCASLVWVSERVLRPEPRAPAREDAPWLSAALEGAREVARSPYLLALVGIVVAYEFASAMTDFVVNVIFERSFHGQVEIGRMFGRLGWIVSATALATQIAIVPLLLPHKRLALLVSPMAMGLATVGLAVLPTIGVAILLASADRGLNYSLQQVTKETLYVPLTDAQKYKAKALIDMVIDRAGKALSSIVLIAIIANRGVSIPLSLAIALGALALWLFCANALGRAYARRTRSPAVELSES